MSGLTRPEAPYPGLRAFRPGEAPIFCGRTEHRVAILGLLENSRFLAVVGASGSGKSSLVLAGLLPDIREGLLLGVDAEEVQIVSMQPGLLPFANLAEALAQALATDLSLEPLLRRGPLGLVLVLDEVENARERPLIVVVDQFEEIFRFADLSHDDLLREETRYGAKPLLNGAQNEAQAFVNLLLAAATQTARPIYILLTMRSDFFARCDEFTGLPEAISRSQFLTPRLDRQQLEQAITRPLRLYHGAIQPELVNLLLNQISNEQDQLPVLQHALALMWERRTVPPSGETITLTMEDYRAVGGLEEALNRHGDSICRALEETPPHVPEASIERFFRCLVHHVSAGIAPVRRPARVAQIAREASLEIETVRGIADAFRAEGCHLLMPPTTRTPELKESTFLDISHEALLRQWDRLKGWTDAEWKQRHLAEEVVSAMEEWKKSAPPGAAGKGGALGAFWRWREAGESVAPRLYREAEPELFGARAPANLPTWAGRYGIDWLSVEAFWKQAARWRRLTAIKSTAGVGLVLMGGALIWALCVVMAKKSAIMEEQRIAEHAVAKVATFEKERAEEARNAAIEGGERAKEAAQLAEDEKEVAVQARAEAESNNQKVFSTISALQTDLGIQAQKLKDVAGALARVPRSEPVSVLLQDPVLKELAGDAAAPKVAAPAPRPRSPGSGAVAANPKSSFDTPTLTRLMSPGSGAAAPVVAFGGRGAELFLVAGAEKLPLTYYWSFSGDKEAAMSQTLEFESRALATGAGSGDVLSYGGDARLRLIRGGGQAVASGPVGAVVTSARVARQKPFAALLGTAAGQVGVWLGEGGTPPQLYNTTHGGIVGGIDYSPRGSLILASGEHGWARLWMLPPGSPPLLSGKLPAHDFAPAGEAALALRGSFSPDGQLALLPSGLNEATLAATQQGFQTVALPHQSSVALGAFSPDGKMLATADGAGRVYLWDLASAPDKVPPPAVLTGHTGALRVLQWAPDGEYLLSAGDDGTPIVWQRPLDRLRGRPSELPFLLPNRPKGVTGASISPDSRSIATVGLDWAVRVDNVRPVVRGTCRWWGGPQDVRGRGGDLALLSESDLYADAFSALFLPKQPKDTKGLISRLDPNSFYVCTRWDYSVTPRSTLRSLKVLLRRVDKSGQPVGQPIKAQAVDWGPPVTSGFTFDLSPGAMSALGLNDGDNVEMEIPLLESRRRPTSKTAR